MKRKQTLIVAGLALILLAMAAYMFWASSVESRPTLMYFRADL
ncbi:MAG: hypothetical protein U9R15_00375 [Chloroflexota bacterium]|nr:hypothetical protein [Chloroflexota bacterium]